jgi:threonine/homoserine/homoserine lactone efflux protein
MHYGSAQTSMEYVMFGIDNYIGFLLAAILLNLTPGADTMYIVTRSVAQGKKAGVVSVLGIATGLVFHTLLAALGLSIILMTSEAIFMGVKYLGAGYLVFIGIKMIIDKSGVFENQHIGFAKTDLVKIYRQGVLTNVLNPKVALFFISFLPQFILPEHAAGPLPFLLLGGTFLTTGTIWCLFLAYTSSVMTNALRNNETIGNFMQKVSGTVFVAVGLQLAFKRG